MTDPVAVFLKFAFIAVLYLFLLWVARSALKDLRRPARQHDPATSPDPAAAPGALRRPILVVERGGGLSPGRAFAVDGALVIGRAPQNEIQIEDQFASGRHARIYESEGFFYVEDMGSTNGTYLNGAELSSRELLRSEDRIRIGDTEFRYELG